MITERDGEVWLDEELVLWLIVGDEAYGYTIVNLETSFVDAICKEVVDDPDATHPSQRGWVRNWRRFA